MGLLGVRAIRHGLAATAAVLVVAAVLAGLSWATWQRAQGQLEGLTTRTSGVVVELTDPAHAQRPVAVRWQPPGAAPRVSSVELAGSVPPPGTRVEVAFDPSDPGSLTLPGSAVIASANRALTNLACTVVVAVGVMLAAAARLMSAARAGGRSRRVLRVRRIRVQAGLLSRSWLELEDLPQRWIPVHFDPVLVTLPTASEVAVHGDPRRDRWVAATVDGRRIHPSGPVHATEPRGRRIDNPTRTDGDTRRRARAATLGRQLRVDLALAVPAPLVGVFWAFLDGGGIASWAGATALVAVVGIWTGAYRGSDPS